MVYVGFPIMALVFMSIFLCIYFSKQRVDIFENKVVISMMFTNIIGLLLELGCYLVLVVLQNQDSFFGMFILKSYIVYIIVFTFLLASYIFVLTNKKKELPDYDIKEYYKKTCMVLLPITLVIILIIYISPLYYYNVYPRYYTYGFATKMLFVVFVILLPLLLFKCILTIIRKNKLNAQVGVVLFGVLLTISRTFAIESSRIPFISPFNIKVNK